MFGKIGRITTAGAITHFTIPTASSVPQSIVTGPDGNLWFTEYGTNKIGRVTTTGTFTEFPVPTAASSPNGIAAGSDGNLWFTERSTNKIGRVTTSGTFTEFTIPTANVSPEGIAAGPDGNLWFAENGGGKIARATTAGVITEFPLPTPTRVFSIVPGPDGNLWFPEFDNNKIGRITTAGAFLEFLIPTVDSGPYGLTAGLDGALWFTEFRKDQIGRVTAPTPPPGARLYTLPPCRLLDTRGANGPFGGPALIGATDRLFTLTGRCGVPAMAWAVAINATVTGATTQGHLTFYPAGSPLPLVSAINYGAGQTRANNTVLSLGAGSLVVRCGQSSGTVHLILDVSGYFQWPFSRLCASKNRRFRLLGTGTRRRNNSRRGRRASTISRFWPERFRRPAGHSCS